MSLSKWKSRLTRKMRPPASFEVINATINRELLESVSASGVLLDAGCGRGKNIRSLEGSSLRFRTIVGIDIYLPDVRTSRSQVSDTVHLVNGNALSLPFANGVFDCVLSNQVIEHIRAYVDYLDELKRVLRAGGYLVVSTPNFHCPRNTFLEMIGKEPMLRWPNLENLPPEQFRGHTQEFTEKELIDLVCGRGFQLVRNRPLQPRATFRGNLLYNAYSIGEHLFAAVSRPFVAPGYSKNNNMLFQRRDRS